MLSEIEQVLPSEIEKRSFEIITEELKEMGKILCPETELIVIYDDISLGVGQLRIRAKGSAGGHNGIKNIIAHLGGQVFPRIKVGVGEKPPKYDLADYVLGHFSKAEQELMSEGYDNAVKAVELIVSDQISEAMNEYNRKKKDE